MGVATESRQTAFCGGAEIVHIAGRISDDRARQLELARSKRLNSLRSRTQQSVQTRRYCASGPLCGKVHSEITVRAGWFPARPISDSKGRVPIKSRACSRRPAPGAGFVRSERSCRQRDAHGAGLAEYLNVRCCSAGSAKCGGILLVEQVPCPEGEAPAIINGA